MTLELIIGGLALAVALINLYFLWQLRGHFARLPFGDLVTKHDLAVTTSTSLERHFQQVQALKRLSHELDMPTPLPPMRGWAASPDFLLTAYQAARRSRPLLVVECGSGVSTLIMARALQQNGEGQILTLDHDGVFAQKTRDLLAEHGLADYAQVLHAPLTPMDIDGESFNWYGYEAPEGLSVDMLIVDGPPEEGPHTLARFPAGPCFIPHLNAGGIILVDDSQRPNEQTAVRRWIERYPGLSSEYLQLEKGCLLVTREGETSGGHQP